MYLGTAAGPELQVLAQESNEGTGTILHDCTKFSRILISPISSELRPQNLSLTAIISSLTAIISNVDFGAAAVRAPPDSQGGSQHVVRPYEYYASTSTVSVYQDTCAGTKRST